MVRLANRAAVLLIASPLATLAITLQEAVTSRPDLSTLAAIATAYPSALGRLPTEGGTLLAPTNDALAAFLEAAGISGLDGVSEETAQTLVSYHIIPAVLRSTDLLGEGGAVAPTELTNEALANLGGEPNSLFASAYGSTGQDREASGLKIYTGIGTPANVTGADIEFDDGVIHVIDRVLNLPQTPSETADAAGLSTLIGALETTDLTETVDATPRVTIFAPTNAAFEASGIDLGALTTEQLADALKYHAIVGEVAYSTVLEDGQDYQTLAGIPVTVHKRDGQLFVNDVAVAVGNVITTNGVVHVISGVLTPPAGATPSPSSSGSGSPTTTSTAPGSSGTSDNADNSASNISSNRMWGLLAAASAALGLFL